MDCGQVNLLSASYGTRLAQLYAARYPESLRRSLMIGVNPPGRMLWDATTTDTKLALWSQNCAQDPEASKRTEDLRAIACSSTSTQEPWRCRASLRPERATSRA